MARRYAVALPTLSLLLFSFALTVPAAAAGAHPVLRGMIDESWALAEPATQEAILTELSDRLHVQAVRVVLSWAQAEPARGQFDETYLGQLDTAITHARAHHLRIMLLVYQVPRWASDQSFWDDPPAGYEPGYQPFYPLDHAAFDDWQAAAKSFATRFRGRVRWWECWCEPNLWSYLYPQRTATDALFAPRLYARMLQRFFKGVRAGDPKALVLGGVTAPIGANDRYRTSPQAFARALRDLGAGRWMDAYSHHPYAPGGIQPMRAPEQLPNFPQYTVDLGNIGTLLRIFPHKPFYLTEYGYTTSYTADFGGGQVSRALQAAYLRRAYRYAARFPQVKMLVWFLRQDVSPSGTPSDHNGLYFGLRDVYGNRKPSWYAYAQLAGR